MKKTVIFLGKRKQQGSPKIQWPYADLWGTTHSNQKYAKRYGTVDDWDSWHDYHPFDLMVANGFRYDGIKKKRPATYRWYQSLPGPDSPRYRPVFLAQHDPTIPAGVVLPIDPIMHLAREVKFLPTCQVDLMFLHAMLLGYEQIILHGHGIGREPSHMVDHAGVLVYMTFARLRGIEVTIVPPSWYLGPQAAYGISRGNWSLR